MDNNQLAVFSSLHAAKFPFVTITKNDAVAEFPAPIAHPTAVQNVSIYLRAAYTNRYRQVPGYLEGGGGVETGLNC
jgi:hypothetical protein